MCSVNFHEGIWQGGGCAVVKAASSHAFLNYCTNEGFCFVLFPFFRYRHATEKKKRAIPDSNSGGGVGGVRAGEVACWEGIRSGRGVCLRSLQQLGLESPPGMYLLMFL